MKRDHLGGETKTMKALREVKATGKVEILNPKKGKSTGASVYDVLASNKGKFASDKVLRIALGATNQYVNQSAHGLAERYPMLIKRVTLTDHEGRLPQGREYTVFLPEGKTLEDCLKNTIFLEV